MTFAGREGGEVEALVTDRYIEALLAAHDRGAHHAPFDADLDPAIRQAATTLSRELVRVHPSFRFEERLATRLSEAAAAMRLPAAAGGGASPVRPAPVAPLDPDLPDPLVDPLNPGGAPGLSRPLLIGGALTSAALSIAGAAYVAWRRGRASTSPMARAVRATRHARATAGPDRAARRRLD